MLIWGNFEYLGIFLSLAFSDNNVENTSFSAGWSWRWCEMIHVNMLNMFCELQVVYVTEWYS